MLSTKCKHCKVRWTPEEKARRIRLHPECIEPWMVAFQEIQKRKAMAKRLAEKRLERAQDKRKRVGLKRIPDLIKEAQQVFNKWVRTRDEKEPCISCGAPPPDLSRLHAGRDAGHYRSTGAASRLRFNEDNCHAQCVKCNQWGAGRAVEYRIGLLAKVGAVRVESLESNNLPHKWERDELIAIKAVYVQKLKQLKGN